MDLYFEVQVFALLFALFSVSVCGNPSYGISTFDRNMRKDSKKINSVNKILDVAKNSIFGHGQCKYQSVLSINR